MAVLRFHLELIMFRSLFTKYITVFMLIIIVSFIIQISIISTLIGSYSDTSKEMSLSRASASITGFITDGLEDMSFRRYVAENGESIVETVKMMMTYAGDMSFVIADENGDVLLTIGDDVPVYPDRGEEIYNVGSTIMDEVISGKNGTFISDENDQATGVFSNVIYVYGSVISQEEGVVGVVFTCSSDSNTDILLDSLINSSIMSSLWIMLAALIAVYFISERVTAPIKNMCAAAKSFAAGDFNTRVVVTGHDEVTELAVAFNNMASSLANLEETRRTFLANVSHDMRTPMTTISGFVDGILDGTIPPEQQNHYLGIVSAEIKRLSRLVSSLLDITRIEAGERKFNMTRFDICEMAREIIISLEKRLEAYNLSVEFNCDSDNIYVLADRDAVYQILYNLCDNGVKFSREGARYRVSITHRGKKVHVYVYNEGVGIAPEELPLVFDRFYKTDKSRGLDKTGVGLGLYIAKTIIEAHGEEIDVRSEYGKFCEFHFTLTAD